MVCGLPIEPPSGPGCVCSGAQHPCSTEQTQSGQESVLALLKALDAERLDQPVQPAPDRPRMAVLAGAVAFGAVARHAASLDADAPPSRRSPFACEEDGPGRCKVCPGCRRWLAEVLEGRALIEAAHAAAMYLVTLTVDVAEAHQLDAEWQRFSRKLRRSCEAAGLPFPAFLRTREFTERRVYHFHLAVFVADGFDPVLLRDWRWISDIELVIGKGRDLDGSLPKASRRFFGRARRLARDASIPWENRTRNKRDGKPPKAAVSYSLKYIRKAPEAGRELPAGVRSFDTTRGFGEPAKGLSVLLGLPLWAAREVVELDGYRRAAVREHAQRNLPSLGPVRGGLERCTVVWRGRRFLSPVLCSLVAVASGYDDRPATWERLRDHEHVVHVQEALADWHAVNAHRKPGEALRDVVTRSGDLLRILFGAPDRLAAPSQGAAQPGATLGGLASFDAELEALRRYRALRGG
jgi:hypothetical protein